MMIGLDEMALRMGAGVVLGAAIGYERERSGRPAGLRTHLLVSLSSATFMLVSTQFVYFQNYGKDDLIEVDTSRIAASVVSGVGFLGAGAILRTGINIQGLTTAASLWLVAAVGLAAGGGMFAVATMATVVTLFCLIVMRRIEGKQWRLLQRKVTLVLEGAEDNGQAIIAQLAALGARVTDVDYDHSIKANKTRLHLNVQLPDRSSLDRMVEYLSSVPHARRVKVERPG